MIPTQETKSFPKLILSQETRISDTPLDSRHDFGVFPGFGFPGSESMLERAKSLSGISSGNPGEKGTVAFLKYFSQAKILAEWQGRQ